MPPMYTGGIGKGLREPVSPYRTAYVFGAELNDVHAGGWNAIPQIVEPTGFYDLSAITKGHEVIVALLGITNTRAGTHHLAIRWYKERDGRLLYEFSTDYTVQAGSWFYIGSYIGWVDWEINENGNYRVEFRVTGADTYNRTLTFNITGIPEEPFIPPTIPPYEVPEYYEPYLPEVGEPAPAAGFMEKIIHWLAVLAEWFYAAWIEVKGWTWPFNYLGNILLPIARGFDSLVANFLDFKTWVNGIIAKVREIISTDGLLGLIRSWFPWLYSVGEWFSNRWSWFAGVIGDWWDSVGPTVLAWIEIAKQSVLALYDTFRWDFVSLSQRFQWFYDNLAPFREVIDWIKNWRDRVYKAIADWGLARLADVTALIVTAFIEREDYWAGWQEIRRDVYSFFQDPLEFLWSLFEDWFTGTEE